MLEPAYLAGIIDGEGCLRIDTALIGRLQIAMCVQAKGFLELLHDTYHGSLTLHQRASKGRQESWYWALTGMRLRDLLLSTLPFMIIKRPQAELILELQNMKLEHGQGASSRITWTHETRSQAEVMRDKLITLNKRG